MVTCSPRKESMAADGENRDQMDDMLRRPRHWRGVRFFLRPARRAVAGSRRRRRACRPFRIWSEDSLLAGGGRFPLVVRRRRAGCFGGKEDARRNRRLLLRHGRSGYRGFRRRFRMDGPGRREKGVFPGEDRHLPDEGDSFRRRCRSPQRRNMAMPGMAFEKERRRSIPEDSCREGQRFVGISRLGRRRARCLRAQA